jgi:hypothetical protein
LGGGVRELAAGGGVGDAEQDVSGDRGQAGGFVLLVRTYVILNVG